MRRRWPIVAGVLLVAGSASAWAWFGRTIEPPLPTVEVTRGTFADVVEIRGDVRPVRSTVVFAPANAGELVVLKIAANGTLVKPGQVVAEFDAVTMRRTIQEKQSELRSALAELDQARAQSTIALEERATAVRKAEFEVLKAKLSLVDETLVGTIEAQRTRLALVDAEQRQREVAAAQHAAKVSNESDFAARDRRIQKIKDDLAKAERAAAALTAIAPIEGTVNILPNYRSGGMMMGSPPEFKPGDRTYAGAPVLELPDLSSVYLIARLDETDRGLLKKGQTVRIRADAVADTEYEATVSDISVLARVDFSGGWPPTRMFDLRITFTNPDERLRPGMSAVARIGVGEIPDVLLVPAGAVFTDGGQPVVYRFDGRRFQAVPVTIVRRGRDQIAIEADVQPGARVSLVQPTGPAGGGAP